MDNLLYYSWRLAAPHWVLGLCLWSFSAFSTSLFLSDPLFARPITICSLTLKRCIEKQRLSQMPTKAALRSPGINNQVVWVSHPRSERKAVNSSLCTHTERACLSAKASACFKNQQSPWSCQPVSCEVLIGPGHCCPNSTALALSVPFLYELLQNTNFSVFSHESSRSPSLDSGNWTSGTLDKKAISRRRLGLARVSHSPQCMSGKCSLGILQCSLGRHSIPHSELCHHPRALLPTHLTFAGQPYLPMPTCIWLSWDDTFLLCPNTSKIMVPSLTLCACEIMEQSLGITTCFLTHPQKMELKVLETLKPINTVKCCSNYPL